MRMIHLPARRLLAILCLCGLGLAACGAPAGVTPVPTPTPTIEGADTATPDPTETEVPEDTETPTETATPDEAETPTATATEPSSDSAGKFTVDEAGNLVLGEDVDVAALKFLRTEFYGLQDAKERKEWFGSAEAAQPFLDDGLLRIAATTFDTGGTKCTKVCYVISSVLIFSSEGGASPAPDLLLKFEHANDATLEELTGEQLGSLADSSTLSPPIKFVGTTGTIGVGQYAQTTFSYYGAHSNAVIVMQGGGVPGAMTAHDIELEMDKLLQEIADSQK
jgi:hypothetical protein